MSLNGSVGGQGNEYSDSEKMKILFSGTPNLLGGLSNEQELVGLCPQEFQNDNPWSSYASKLFFRGANISNWKWRQENEHERKRQLNCFSGLLGSFDIDHEDKEAVAGWMLSIILVEVPEWAPSKRE